MPLECVMVMLDNSAFSRNGDATPSRYLAQTDAIISLVNYKLSDNVETCVGLMTMAGNSGQIVTTPVNQTSAITSKFNGIEIGDRINFVKAISVAQLALKHRVNKHQHERIVMFVASNIRDSPAELFKIAKNLRRNNTALEIINICNPQNVKLIEQMIEIVNVDDNSRLIDYNGGSESLLSILRGTQLFGKGNQGAVPQFEEEMDPELEMVLRISLEEEKKRLEELKKKEEAEKSNEEEKKALIDQATVIVNENGESKTPNKEGLTDIINDLKLNKDSDKNKPNQPK